MINKNQNRILILIIILLVLLITCILTVSFSMLPNNNVLQEENKTSHTLTKKTENKDLTTSETNETTNTSTTIIQIPTTQKTTKQNIESTTQNTTKINIQDNISTTKANENNLLKEMYYYKWTEDNKRDYTGRNCLFLYDINGNIVDGYVTILYYDKYIKEQYVTDNVNNCFLEDKFSTKILKIKKNNKEYHQ